MNTTESSHVIASLQDLTTSMDKRKRAAARRRGAGMSGLVRMALVAVMMVMFGVAGLVAMADAAVAPVTSQNWPATPQLNGTTGNLAGTFAIDANADLLLVSVHAWNATNVTNIAVTFGGQPLTPASFVYGYYRVAWIGYLNKADLLSRTGDAIAVTFTGSHGDCNASIAAYQGTDPTNPVTGVAGEYFNQTGVNQLANSITVPDGGYAVFAWSDDNQTLTSNSEGYTEHSDWADTSFRSGVSSKEFATGATTNPALAFAIAGPRLALTHVGINPLSCTDPDPSTITIGAGQAASGNPYNVSGLKTSAGDVGSFEYMVTGPGVATITNPQAWTNLYNVATSPVNANYTVNAGTDRMLVVGVAMALSGTATASCSASYDGNALVKATSDEASNIRQHTWLFYLKDTPASMDGTANPLNVTCSNNGGRTIRNLAVYASVFAGVDQTASPLTDARTYNSGGTNVTNPTFSPALTENAGNQPVVIGLSDRTGSTAGARTMTAAANWTLVNTQTRIATDSIRTGVLNRAIPAANTTDTTPFTIATGSLASMSGMSLKPGLTAVPCTNWTSNSLITASSAGGSLCGDYTDGGTYNLSVRGTDPDCGTVVAATPANFTWNSCSETQTLTAPSIAGPVTGSVVVTAGGTATGIQVSWSENGGGTWSSWVASGATYTPPTCTSGSVIFRAQGTGTCGTLTAQSGSVVLNTLDSGPGGDLATLTVTGPASPVTGIQTVQVQVGTETAPDTLSAVIVNITGSSACDVSNAFMSWNGATSRWEYSWDTSACGTGAVESGVSLVARASDPDCYDTVTSPAATVTIDNTCIDSTSTVTWTVPGAPVTAPLVVTATGSAGVTGIEVSFDDGTTWLPNGSTYTPKVDAQGTSIFRLRALDTCGKRIYGGTSYTTTAPGTAYNVPFDGRLDRIRPLRIEAEAVGKTSIRVQMEYCSDKNGNALTTVRYKLTSAADLPASWTTVGPYVDGGDADGLPNQLVLFMLTGLTTDTNYDIEIAITETAPDVVDWTTIQGVAPTAPPWKATIQLTSWLDSNLMHNALRFACSKIGFANQADCIAAGGTWNLDRKWPGGWGLPNATYPNAQYESFECGTCHVKNSSNVKRVITAVTPKADGPFPGSAVSLQDVREGTAEFGDDSDSHTTSTRVCEVCHSQTTYHRQDTTAQANKLHNNKTDCIRCHEHNVGYRASCDSCHGTPPVDVTGLATQPATTGSTVWGEHQKHAVDIGYDCKTCHNGWDGTDEMPKNGNLNIGFKPSVNPQFAGATRQILGGTYEGRTTGGGYTGDITSAPYNTVVNTATGAMTCAVYCHGYGLPVWNPTSSQPCGSCHGKVNSGVGYRSGAPTGISGSADLSGATTGFKIGKHATHLDDSVAKTGDPCALCHYGYSYTDLTHVNGTVNVVMHPSVDVSPSQRATFTAGSPGTCSNMNCHGATPWDSAAVLTCTQSCHGYPPVTTINPVDSSTYTAYTGTGAINFVNHDSPNGFQYLKDNHGQCKYCHGWNDDGDGALPIVGMTAAELTAMNGDPTEVPNLTNYSPTNTVGQHNEKAFLSTPQITMNDDQDADGANDADYDPTTGGCDNAVCHGNDAAHRLNIGTGSGNLIQPADIGPGDCGACHTTGVGGATVVKIGTTAGSSSPHTDADGPNGSVYTVDVAAPTAKCTNCHSGHYTKLGGVKIPNNPVVGINYLGAQHGGINIGGSGTDASISAKTTEAEVCWGCHDIVDTNAGTAGIQPVSEWGTNSKMIGSPVATQYNYGTLSTSDWTTATWSSGKGATFAYKTGAIQSTHAANSIEAGATSALTGTTYAYRETVDDVGLIRCSYCHDVHDAGGVGVGPTGKPYLRGTWWSNPYEEDGAPQAGQVFENILEYGAVPRGGQNTTNMQKRLGGFWIDANNVRPGTASTTVNGTPYANPTITGGTGTGGAWNLSDSAGLCVLCHTNNVNAMDQQTGEALWFGTNGHANSAIGGTGTASGNSANIFELRGGTAADNINPAMHFKGASEPGDSNATSYRNGNNSVVNYTPSINAVSENTLPYAVELWGAALSYDNTTTNNLYHKFSCSKCHNPHASRLPKLMITNCLDTKHNTWDDSYQLNTQSATSINYNRSLSNWTSAQNCHRVGGIIPATRIIPATGGTYPEPVDAGAVAAPAGTLTDYQNRGWNTVTPW